MKAKPIPKFMRHRLERIGKMLLDIQADLCEANRAHVADRVDVLRRALQEVTYGHFEVKK